MSKMSNEKGKKRHFIRKNPLRNYDAVEGAFKEFCFAANSITGYRLDQEDRYICLPAPHFYKDWSFFGIYDGHGGALVAEYLKRNLHNHILEKLDEFGNVPKALEHGFLACDHAIRYMSEDEFVDIEESTVKAFPVNPSEGACETDDELHNEIRKHFLLQLLKLQTDINQKASTSRRNEAMENDKGELRRSKRLKKMTSESSNCVSSEVDNNPGTSMQETDSEDEEGPLVGLSMGSTATVLIFTDKMLYVANVGDSECIASNNGELRILSIRHDLTSEVEKKRIVKSGHFVYHGRVDGMINMSRAFGDFMFKNNENVGPEEQSLISKPSIIGIEVEAVDFVVVASDGIWNSLGRELVHRCVKREIKDVELKDIPCHLFDRILATRHKEGYDNMSVIIINNTEKAEVNNEEKPKKAIKRKAK